MYGGAFRGRSPPMARMLLHIGCMRCKMNTGLGCGELCVIPDNSLRRLLPGGQMLLLFSHWQLINLYCGIWFCFTLLLKGKIWYLSTWVLFLNFLPLRLLAVITFCSPPGLWRSGKRAEVVAKSVRLPQPSKDLQFKQKSPQTLVFESDQK